MAISVFVYYIFEKLKLKKNQMLEKAAKLLGISAEVVAKVPNHLIDLLNETCESNEKLGSAIAKCGEAKKHLSQIIKAARTQPNHEMESINEDMDKISFYEKKLTDQKNKMVQLINIIKSRLISATIFNQSNSADEQLVDQTERELGIAQEILDQNKLWEDDFA